MRILYIGNDLSGESNYHSAYATLKHNLTNEDFDLITSSSKKNQILRLFDMMITVIVNRKKVDYVLIDVFSTFAFYFALLTSQLSRLFNLKYIPILHGGNLPNRLNNNPKMCQYIFGNSYVNISPSNYLKTAFEKVGHQCVLIPNTIKIKEYVFKERQELKPNLLYVRAFASIYNPLMAVDVLNQLKNTHPNATLCMVGPDRDGTLSQVEEKIKELNLQGSIKITGVLPKEEWHKLSINYDVFINTTNVDNTPVSLIETMALGLPIVTTNVGGIPYLIDENKDGIMVNPNDVDMMNNAIITILDNHLLAKEFSCNGRQKAESMDWNVVKHQWIKILK